MEAINTKEVMELRAKLDRKITGMGYEIGQVIPDGYNQSSKYKFISSDLMLSRCRNLFQKNLIDITYNILKVTETLSSLPESTTKDGVTIVKQKQIIRTIVDMEMFVDDLETGYREVYKWAGADQDYGGKSFGKAVTEGVKRFLFKTFSISSCADIDSDLTTNETENVDPVDFCGRHPAILALLKKKHPNRSVITKICEDNDYDIAKMEKAFSELPDVEIAPSKSEEKKS